MAAASQRRIAILGGDPRAACGIGDFAKGLVKTLRERPQLAIDDVDLNAPSSKGFALWRRLKSADTVIANLPLVAWKKLPLRPALAIAIARLTGKQTIVLLHEWQGLHRLRRLVLMPIVAMAHQVVLFSPTIRDELGGDRLLGWKARKAALAPLPPNIERPTATADSEFARQLRAAKGAGRLIVGVFGSIYPGKQPLAALRLAHELKARGENPLIAFVGSFVKASDNIEKIFWAAVRAEKLEDNIAVSGFVADDAALYAIFAEIDVFAYRFAEGMTARRASVLAAVQAGRPVVVTAPRRADEFAHHARFATLIEDGALVLVPATATDTAYADAIVHAARKPSVTNALSPRRWWDDLASVMSTLLRR